MNCLSVLSLARDGIGPEVVGASLKVLDYACTREGISLTVDHDLVGGATWDVHRTLCRDETVAVARASLQSLPDAPHRAALRA